MSKVNRQGDCSSCWAVAAVAVVERLNAIRRGTEPVDHSLQELVDCCNTSNGCRSGMVIKAFDDIFDYDVLACADTYAYTATQGTCKAADIPPAFDDAIDGYERVPSFNIRQLMLAVNSHPVVVTIDAVGN